MTEVLKTACKGIVTMILEGLREVVSQFDPEFQSRMLNNIVLGGGGSQLKGLDRAIEDALRQYSGGKVQKVSDAVFAGANGAPKLAKRMPPESWNQVGSRPVEEQPRLAA